MNAVRSTVGHERESWRIAMQAEVDSLWDNGAFQDATAEELRGVPMRKILPMKMVVDTKRDHINKAEKKKGPLCRLRQLPGQAPGRGAARRQCGHHLRAGSPSGGNAPEV